MKPKTCCEHCGAKMVEYKHSFSHALAIGLNKLYLAGKSNINELGLNRNQWDNFQKLRYWGLVQQSYRDDGSRENGVWSITELGKQFRYGTVFIKKSVWTYRGVPVRQEGKDILFSDFNSVYYDQRPDYVRTSKPHMEAHRENS